MRSYVLGCAAGLASVVMTVGPTFAADPFVGTETLESTLKIGGRSIMTTTEVMAEDSNTLTSTTIGTTQSGTPIRNVQVYERK